MSPESSIAHYRITAMLGKGGMGAVYRATDTILGRDVAIKVIPDSFADDADRLLRFKREAQLLASLNHPNIAAIYGVEARAIVLELVEGNTLSGPMSEDEALPLIHQLIDALEYAHEKGVVHRDLKPANIKVTPEGRLKVLDFGLAKALSSDTTAPVLDSASSPNSATLTMSGTIAGAIMGTAGYMSPEQARGQVVDKRADIWAFGVVVREMLTGQRVFAGDTVSDTLAAVLRDDPNIGAVPPRFRRLLRLCLTRDPRQRLRDISGARLLLDEAAAERAPGAGRPTKWMAATAAVAAVAIAALGVAWRATRPVERPLMRLSVDLGPEALAGARTVIALPPNGRRIVFVARSTEGKQVLATRQLDQAKVELLPGTEGATDPFFSPDGEWIGFFADGKLKKVSVQGGAPSVLSGTSTNPRGATWGEDGSIVFTPMPATGLTRIPANGGPAQTLTNPAARGQVTHRWPQFLPGGNALIFTSHTATTGLNEAEIDALDLKTGQWKTVQRGGFFGRYLPSGHLVYVHGGVLFGVRFDAGRLETRGSPVALMDDVAANEITASGRFDFSLAPAGSGTLGYMSGKPESVPAQEVWLEKTGTTQLAAFEGGTAGSPALSPDGKLVALEIGGIGSQNIKVWDGRRDVMISITSNSQGNVNPVWAPDGKHLVFSSTFNNVSALWWARADGGGEPRKLAESKTPFSPSSVSPDGRHVAYSQIAADTTDDLWTLPLDISDPENPKPGTPEVFLRTPAAERRPVFSTDGRWIAYSSQETGPWEIHVRPFPVRAGRWQISAGDGILARWSRIGRQLLYATSDGRIMAADYDIQGDSFLAGKPRLWTEARISANMGHADFDVTPDGQRVLTSVNPVDRVEQSTTVHVTFLLNFFDELKKRVP